MSSELLARIMTIRLCALTLVECIQQRIERSKLAGDLFLEHGMTSSIEFLSLDDVRVVAIPVESHWAFF